MLTQRRHSSPSDTDYNALLHRSKNGDAAAREQLFSVLQVRLWTILKYRLRRWPEDELKDIMQNTLLVVADKLPQIESNPDLFALDVLRNKIGNSLSRAHRRVDVSLDATDSRDDSDEHDTVTALPNDSDPADDAAHADLVDTIRGAIKKLSPLCQALFVALLENQSVADTWELLQRLQPALRRSAFDKRLFDCRKKLRSLIAHAL